jgi:hypothetical protein
MSVNGRVEVPPRCASVRTKLGTWDVPCLDHAFDAGGAE